MMHNEEKMLPYFLRHYGMIADKIVVFEDSSTDRTLEILKSHPKVEVRKPIQPLIDDRVFARTFSNCYRDDRSPDWVICVDGDELVWHEDRLAAKKKAGYDVILTYGYEMKAHGFPTTPGLITDQVKWGERCTLWGGNGVKACVFSPKVDIEFGPGRHYYAVNSRTRIDIAGFKLLHYRNLGYDFYLWHHQRNAGRLDPKRADLDLGSHNHRPMVPDHFASDVARGEWVLQ